jgi:hypothetical protein
MSDTKTVRLSQPIPYGGERLLEEITLRRPTAGDLRGIRLARIEEVDVDTVLTITPRIATTPVTAAQLAQLDPADLVTLAAEIVSFFAPSRTDSQTTPAAPGA